jgi:PD-(D/E)XK nuclease superfamily/Triosephosphate isomerase
MTPTSNTRDLLTSVHGRLSGLRAARTAYARRLAPKFNTLTLLRPDELRLSSLLAELLDPEGNHAQGRKFWNLFAEHFELPAWAGHAKQFRIQTEAQTDGSDRTERRIDVLVELDGKSAVAIENKPWAADQNGQVSDYLDHLQVRYPSEHVLIYLSGNGRDPEPSSIRDEEKNIAFSQGRLQVVGFSDLLPWLAACRSACEAPTVATFLCEFENYIRAEFLGVQDMIENDLIIEEATRNAASIEAAFEIARAANNIKKKLLGDLEVQIRSLMKEAHTPWNLTANTDWSAKVLAALAVRKTTAFAPPRRRRKCTRSCARLVAKSAALAEVPLLYGGSVKPENAEALFRQADSDGGLIGGASLKGRDFLATCVAAHAASASR